MLVGSAASRPAVSKLGNVIAGPAVAAGAWRNQRTLQQPSRRDGAGNETRKDIPRHEDERDCLADIAVTS